MNSFYKWTACPPWREADVDGTKLEHHTRSAQSEGHRGRETWADQQEVTGRAEDAEGEKHELWRGDCRAEGDHWQAEEGSDGGQGGVPLGCTGGAGLQAAGPQNRGGAQGGPRAGADADWAGQ